MNLFVSCPKGLQYLLESELREIGLQECKPVQAGVEVVTDKAGLYRTLLWSRIANRMFLELGSAKVDQADDIYKFANSINWDEHFSQETTFAISFSGTNAFIKNSAFGALKVKDGVVDWFRARTGTRPSIDKTLPQIRIAAKLAKGRLTLSLDLSGDSLHKRGYRIDKGPAPLKENLAAALLRQAGWTKEDTNYTEFLDPMCGSGTFCIEAALIATDTAPGLSRTAWGFDFWLQHDATAWQQEIELATSRSIAGQSTVKPKILGFDQDARVVAHAWENIERAGVKAFVHVEKRELAEFAPVKPDTAGLLLTNPPYGVRLGDVDQLRPLYRLLGKLFEEFLFGWMAGVLTSNQELEGALGWKYSKRYKHFNGSLEAALILIEVTPENRFKQLWSSDTERLQNPEFWTVANPERASMLRNRLRKNAKALSKWVSRNEIACYRLYDADMPEYSFAIDLYRSEEGELHAYIQEYAPPKNIDSKVSMERLCEGLAIIQEVTELNSRNMFLAQRQIQKGLKQYERAEDQSKAFVTREGEARIEIRLGEYLDTGLFLDHRPMRKWMHDHSKGKKVLNLFSYTCAVSLQSAIGGACSVHSIDMSQTYLAWGKRNFKLNGLNGGNYQFERADCINWLELAAADEQKSGAYDLIFLDPPSFSNSKRMEGVLDLQRDHASLIENAMALLSETGTLVFSTNLRKFKLDSALDERFKVMDFSSQSLDKDFERNKKIHQCWLIQH